MGNNGSNRKTSVLFFAALQAAVLFYSFSMLLTKMAGQEEGLTGRFFLLYGGALVIMGVYAVCWQQFLKKLPLTTAYSSRTVSMIWSMILGALLLREKIRFTAVIGTVLILAGLFVIISADREERDDG